MTPPDLFALVRRAARGLLVDARSVGRSGWSQNRLRKAPSRPSRSSGSSPPRGPRSRPVEGLPSGPRTGSGSGPESGPKSAHLAAASTRNLPRQPGVPDRGSPAWVLTRQSGPACQPSSCRVSQGQPASSARAASVRVSPARAASVRVSLAFAASRYRITVCTVLPIIHV